MAALVVCLAATVCVLAQVSRGQDTRPSDIDEQRYTDLITLYRLDPGAAVEEMLRWLTDRVDRGAAAFERRTTPVTERRDVTAMFTAVMLHTDAGLKSVARNRRVDGGLHLSKAAALLRRLDLLVATGQMGLSKKGAPLSLGSWSVAVPRVLNGLWAWEVEEYVLSSWGKGSVNGAADAIALKAEGERPGLGAQFLLALASLEHGTVQIERKQQEVVEMPSPSAQQRLWGLNRARVEQAERFYRRSLDLDPALLEARLGLGRLLAEGRRAGAARAELRRVLSETRQARQTYLAYLFLGQVEEDEGSIAQAIDLYRRALAAWPASQAARIALANGYEKSGDLPAARSLVVSFFAREEAGWVSDPWSQYLAGDVEPGGRALDEMRARVLSFGPETTQ